MGDSVESLLNFLVRISQVPNFLKDSKIIRIASDTYSNSYKSGILNNLSPYITAL